MSDIVLISGGLDSFVAYHYLKAMNVDAKPLYIDLGHPYAWKEREAIEKFAWAHEVDEISCDVIRKSFGNYPDEKNIWIPGRNLLMAVIAMCSGGSTIWISALKGEMHKDATDKNLMFFQLLSGLGSYVFSKFDRQILVTTPFYAMSKYDVVKWALENGITKEDLMATSSCMSGDAGNCGNCMVCVRRWGIFKQFGFEEVYNQNPWESPNGMEYIATLTDARDRQDYTHYDLDRITEVLNVSR